LASAVAAPPRPAAADDAVLVYHGQPDRAGIFTVPGLTWQRARNIHLDAGFAPRLAGHLYAQPLFLRTPAFPAGLLLVATESDVVAAIDAATGDTVWSQKLGDPVPLSALACGNIDPLGVTGTPAIDPATNAIYLDAMVAGPAGPRHLVFALSLSDGAPLPGWPVDVAAALAAQGLAFNAPDQNQRGALAIFQGRVLIPYGGHAGDCGDYHGWVVGIGLSDPGDVVAWSTRARGGGIWTPGGISSDGRSLFVATGNTMGTNFWQDGEAVIRLHRGLRHDPQPADFFTPRYWHLLDERDSDLGGTYPLPLDVPSTAGSQALVLALGKDAHAYLLDRNNLGGLGGSLFNRIVGIGGFIAGPAAYSINGHVHVAFQGRGAACPAATPANGLIVLRIEPGEPPRAPTAWCGALPGQGAPIVTTTDGAANPIVWSVGAEGDNRLHGYRGDTGEPLFTGGGAGDLMAGLHHFQTLLATQDRLYVGADGRIYAFVF
jgi:hypothetical protein